MKFLYQARNQQGQIAKGYVIAANAAKAEQLLAENNFIIISLKEQRENLLTKVALLFNRVSNKDIVLFSRQLSTLVAARVPILQALRILENQVSNEGLLFVVRSLITSIEGGESLSLAMSKHPEVFDNLFVALVKAGEAAGTVGESLTYLADQAEKDYDLRSKVKGAMTYPAFVLLALAIVGVLMFKFVLPKLTEVLREQGGELPLVSVWLISFTDFFQVYWWVIILLICGGVLGIRLYIDTVSGRYVWDRLKVSVPAIGDMFEKVYMARFSRNMATLVAGGIPIIQAMKILSEVLNNVIYRDIILEASKEVTNGRSVNESLAKYPEFPPLVTQMIKVGEQTAELDTILLKLAAFYEKEVDAKIATLSTLLEPMIMIILGVGVGLLVAGVLLPIYNLASTT